MKLDPYLTSHIKINSKGTKDLNITAKVIKFLEENIGQRLHVIEFGSDFLDMNLKNIGTKEKIDKLDFIKILFNCSSKDNTNRVKRLHRMGENICKSYIDD